MKFYIHWREEKELKTTYLLNIRCWRTVFHSGVFNDNIAITHAIGQQTDSFDVTDKNTRVSRYICARVYLSRIVFLLWRKLARARTMYPILI